MLLVSCGGWNYISIFKIIYHLLLSKRLILLGKCIPVTRGGGIYQEQMSEALDVLNGGGWVRLFSFGLET